MNTPKGFDYDVAEIVNPEDYIGPKEYNPGMIRAYLVRGMYNSGGVALAECASDALDIIADAGKLKAHRVDDVDTDDTDVDTYAYLGNYGELYDLEHLYVEEFDLPFDPREEEE